MKSPFISIKLAFIFTAICGLSCFLPINKSFSQGFNNNEWIFGYCGSTEENSYLSFGKGGDPIVRTIPGSIVVGADNNALAIDPITGQKLFYTNGELVYNFDDQIIQGAPNGIDGDFTGRQTVAISALNYDPNGLKLFYSFYISPSGQLLYSVIDMDAPGGATGNQPPLGEVIALDLNIGTASGAIAVVKSAQSASYLISFSGSELIARRIEPTQGDFTQTDTEGIPFSPKSIIYQESDGKLLLIPENPNDDLIVLDFDSGSGSFGSQTSITASGGPDEIEGAAFSPDGSFVYFSQGDALKRVPVSDLGSTPETVELDSGPFKVYDVKIGPDGKLYYLYEEVNGGPQLMGVVNNPDEVDLDLIEVEEDPFNGTDFCGRIFPQFAPNQDIDASVDFIWNPTDPCSNNPIQLTSVVSPENFRPVSFEWTFDPPLTDEDGDPVDIDFNQEHLLIPADAASGQSVTVTLTVTFADGTTLPVTKTINLTENDLQAQFSAQDTTVCEGACVDIGSLLQVQKGGDQGGENPNVGGGGQSEVYEYFWSNRRNEGWVSDKNNCVDLPGLYWVMVREPGSDCYAYASIRVKIWDLPDQSNNIWYFGDGAGLDFNPDPSDPDGPSPRPISQPHSQNIPAGTSTISDETGQVLFFTDGASVWDLNGDLMANGDSIGGDNLSSESVIAVPVPQDETIFYLFTTQKSDNGENEVKFSVVDIKAENPLGIGNVVSKGNFLFSPSTEHTAGLSSGDTTWMMFHELGNNTFRAYPVTANGIGPPALSSVGSNHSFGTGVGSMKFSPDGSKLAVTIQEGNCSKLEIFDFDQDTGQLTAYALLDLGCGEEIYGLEFSNDSNRVFVSYIGSGSKVEEYIIQDPSEPAPDGEEPTPSSCAECFQNARNREQIQACILGTRNNISSDGPFGALQIGPDGQIYVARPGQNVLGQIQVAQNCDDSFYNENGSEPMPGTSNLGLPSFVQQSGSNIPDPVLSGPERLCLDPATGAEALFDGEGEPDIDSYFWTIIREDGVVELAELGGAGEAFQTLEHFFQTDGLFTVTLRVDRCGDANYFEEQIEVLVVAPPRITLQDDVTLCSNTPVTLTAIEGYDPADGLYDFEWRNAAGILFGDVNSNSIEVNEESIYTVTVGHRIPADQEGEFFDVCPASKSIFVGPAFEFDLTFSAEEVCYDESLVVFAPNTPVSGEWYYQQVGNPNRILLGEFFELELVPKELPSPGLYEIIFITQDPVVEGCLVEKSVELTVHPLPNFDLQVLNNADDCATPNGSFEITMLLDADLVEVVETGQTFTGVDAGDVLFVEDLAPGNYSVQALTAFGCQLIQTVSIVNLNPPIELEYTVLINPEVCGPTGVEDGAIIISFTNGPQSGSYVVTRQGDGQQFADDFVNSDTLVILVGEGEYAVSVSNGIGCSVPEPVNYQVDGLEAVVFSIPTDLIACDSFTFSPQTDQNLIFTLLDPLGNPVLSDVDGNFVLTTSGTYLLKGEDPDGIDCPREVEMQVTINNPLDYSVSEPIIDCDVGISYSAMLNSTNPADVYFLWRDPEGVIVGRTQTFYPSKAGGTYSLEIQPRMGASCPTAPIEFEVEEFGQEVDVIMELLPFCAEDPFTLITLNADLSQVTAIQWFLVQSSNSIRIPEFDDAEGVTILNNGTYEAVLFNTYGCIVGWGRIQVTKSTIVPPVVEPSFVICGPEGVGTEIDPGDYPFYSWQLDGVEIADTPTFTPVLPGEYTLTVSDEIGCEFSVVFEAVEDCELKIIFPNALRPSDPSRHFIIYANDFIDEIDVFIYNRWGQLIYYCEQENVNGEETVCTWDGTVGGNAVPIGTYPVVVRYRSIDQNLVKTLKKSILVIE